MSINFITYAITSLYLKPFRVSYNIKINDIKHFLEKVHKLENCPINLLNSLDQNLTALILKVNNIGEHNLKLTKTKLLKKKDFSGDLKNLIEITYLEFTESLKNIEGFLAQKQASLKKEIKKILPEILQILCAIANTERFYT